MLKDILRRVEDRLEAVGLSASAASKTAGLSADAIRNLRRAAKDSGRQGVSTKTITALAPVLKTNVNYLLKGEGDPEETSAHLDAPEVRVIGRVGADPEGRIIRTLGQDMGDSVPAPTGGTSKAVALLVDGHSMRGFADDGSLVFFEDQRTPPTEDMIGEVVVVQVAGEGDESDDEDVLVKRLQRGSKPNLYNLESIVGPLMTDVRIRWAAEIIQITPPRQARRLIRRGIA